MGGKPMQLGIRWKCWRNQAAAARGAPARIHGIVADEPLGC